MNRLLAALLVFALACGPQPMTAARWKQSTHDDRVLYVHTLLGAEKVKTAKGGTGKTYDQPAEAYVTAIDAAYANGDTRTPDAIFAAMGK